MIVIWAALARSEDFFDGVDDAESRRVMQQARERIEEVRKGDFTLLLVDEAGQPIAGDVVIEMSEHEFLFGGAMTYSLDLRGSPLMAAAYRAAQEVAKDLFNIVAINCHWYDLQPTIDGPHDWTDTDWLINWAKENGFTIRGHSLIYLRTPIPAPRWIGEVESTEQWWQLVDAHFKAVAERYGDDYPEMDVMNEPRYQKEFRAKYRWMPKLDAPETGRRYFEIAQKHFKETTLMPLDQWTLAGGEENGERRAAMQVMQDMIDAGAEVDAIGTQGHFFPGRGFTSMRQGNLQGGPDAFQMKAIDRGLDAPAAFNLPVHITEFDPPSRNGKIMDRYPNQPRMSDEESAAWQVNFYTLAFSKPHIKEVTRWFIVDGVGGNSLDGGLVRADGTKKPAYHALKKLIQEAWHTRWSGKADDGKVILRGFFGTYEVKVAGHEMQTVELLEQSPCEIEVKLKKVSQ